MLYTCKFSESPHECDQHQNDQLFAAQVGEAIETALGSAQDIEGVVEENDDITVVQTRPQV